ncbi:hypothetical protein GGF32_008162 [Allomyces javanicus]|nr:hypothetical protein GGF32_008162 [Allomyces javanicus]
MAGSWHPLRLLRDGIGVVPLIFLGIALATRYIPVFQRKFYVDDESIQYPMAKHETVTSLHLLLLSLAVPSLMVLAWSWVRSFSPLQAVYSLNALFLSLSWTMAITDVTKIVVGRLRPDFLDRCKPVEHNGTWTCTGDAHLVRNGRVSFPSGHSSLTFSGWVFVALFIWGTLAASSWRRSPWVQSVLALFLIPPALVAISRTTDYRHHWQDVTVGSLLGIIVSYLWYRSVFGRPTAPYTAVPLAGHRSGASSSAGSVDSRIVGMGRPLAASPSPAGPVGAPFLAHEQLAKQAALRDVV